MPASIILKEKQSRILITLRSNQQAWYIASLAKAADTTYVHACNFIKTCETLGLVTNEKHGKIKEIKLTERGIQLADMLNSVTTLITQQSQAQQAKQQLEQAKNHSAVP